MLELCGRRWCPPRLAAAAASVQCGSVTYCFWGAGGILGVMPTKEKFQVCKWAIAFPLSNAHIYVREVFYLCVRCAITFFFLCRFSIAC